MVAVVYGVYRTSVSQLFGFVSTSSRTLGYFECGTVHETEPFDAHHIRVSMEFGVDM